MGFNNTFFAKSPHISQLIVHVKHIDNDNCTYVIFSHLSEVFTGVAVPPVVDMMDFESGSSLRF